MQLQFRLDWSEMDMFAHINNVSYFKYLQAARINYWEQIGLKTPHTDGLGPMLASTGCQFRKPLFYPGNIIIDTSVQFIKNTSFGLLHRIYNADGELAAEGNDVVVLYDFLKHEKAQIPDWFRQKIAGVEGREL